MQYRTLPNTDLKVSAIAFGCMSTVTSPTYPGAEEQLVIDTIHAAIDAGITLIDTAPMYAMASPNACWVLLLLTSETKSSLRIKPVVRR